MHSNWFPKQGLNVCRAEIITFQLMICMQSHALSHPGDKPFACKYTQTIQATLHCETNIGCKTAANQMSETSIGKKRKLWNPPFSINTAHSPLPFLERITWLAIAKAIAGSEKLQLFLIPLPGRIPDARLIAYILIPWSLLTPARSPPGTSAGHGDQSGTKMFPRALSTNQAVRKASAILLGILVTAIATLSPRSNPRAQE